MLDYCTTALLQLQGPMSPGRKWSRGVGQLQHPLQHYTSTLHYTTTLEQYTKLQHYTLALHCHTTLPHYHTTLPHHHPLHQPWPILVHQPDMENEPGKPGTARVNFVGSGKFLGLDIRAFCCEGLSSLGKVAHHG